MVKLRVVWGGRRGVLGDDPPKLLGLSPKTPRHRFDNYHLFGGSERIQNCHVPGTKEDTVCKAFIIALVQGISDVG